MTKRQEVLKGLGLPDYIFYFECVWGGQNLINGAYFRIDTITGQTCYVTGFDPNNWIECTFDPEVFGMWM